MDPIQRTAFPGRRPRGRPPVANPRHEEITVYCNAEEKDRIAQRAKDGRFNSVSDYLRSGGLRGWVRRVRIALTVDQQLGPLQELVDWAKDEGNHDLAARSSRSLAQIRTLIRSL